MADNFNKDTFEEIKSISSRVMADMADASAVADKLKDTFSVQKNLAAAQMTAQRGNIREAKVLVGVANMQKDVISAIKDGSLEQLDIQQMNNDLKSRMVDISKEEEMLLDATTAKMKVQIEALKQKDILGKSHADVLAQQAAKQQEQKDILKDLESSTIDIYNTLKSTVASPLAAFAWIGKQIYGSFTAILDTSKELGLSFSQSVTAGKEISKSMMQTARYGATMKENAEAFSAIVGLAGDLTTATAASVANVTKMTKLAGLGAAEAAELNRTFTLVSGGSQDIASDMTNTVLQMSRAAKVAPAKVFADMAASSELIYIHGKESVKNITMASIAAKKLGVEFSAIAAAGEQTLDIESSIEQEMQASALIGRQINLNKIREMTMAGDVLGTQKEMVKQLGTQAQWDSLNLIQKKALAGAMGLQVADAAKLIANQKEIANIEGEIVEGMKSQTAEGDNAKDKWRWLFNKEHLLTVIASGYLLLKVLSTFPKALHLVNTAFKITFGAGRLLIGGITKSIGFMTAKMLSFFKVSKLQSIGMMKSFGRVGGFFKGLQAKIMGTQKVAQTASKNIETGAAKRKTWTRNPLVNWLNTWNRLKPAALGKFTLAVGVMILTLPALAWGLKQFSDVPWDAALIGMASLMGLALSMKMIGNMTGNILKGSLAMILLSAALIPAAYAFSLLAGIDPKSIIAFSLALPILAFGVIALGAAIMSTLPFFAVGVIGLAALGGAMILLGIGLEKISGALGGFGDIFSNIGQTFSDMKPLLADFVTLAPALLTMGISFGLLTAGLIGFAGALLLVGVAAPILTLLAANMNIIDVSIKGISSNLVDFATNLLTVQGTLFTSAAGFGMLALSLVGVTSIATLAGLSIAGLSLSVFTLIPAIPVLMLFAGGMALISSSLNSINVDGLTEIKNILPDIATNMSALVTSAIGLGALSVGMLSLAGAIWLLAPVAPILLITTLAVTTLAGGLALMNSSLNAINVDGLLQLNGLLPNIATNMTALISSVVGIGGLALGVLTLSGAILTLLPAAPILMITAIAATSLAGGLMTINKVAEPLAGNLGTLVPSLMGIGTGLVATASGLLMLAGLIPIMPVVALGVMALGGALLFASPGVAIFANLINGLSESLPVVVESLKQITFTGFTGISGIVTDLFSLTSAMFLMATTVPAMMLLAFSSNVLANSMEFMASSGSSLANSLASVRDSLSSIVPSFNQLIGLTPGLYTLSSGILALGASIIPLAASLAVVSPLMAVLDKLGSISKVEESKTEVAAEVPDNTEHLVAIAEKLDQIIGLTAEGSKIYLNDREMGRWVGLHASKINAIENRG